jgi:hypothetical protein
MTITTLCYQQTKKRGGGRLQRHTFNVYISMVMTLVPIHTQLEIQRVHFYCFGTVWTTEWSADYGNLKSDTVRQQ